MAVPSSRGLGVTQADLDASRLVFVSVKDAKPKRKVAVPLPEGCSWEAFTQQVRTKLKLAAIDSIYLASSGERVTSLDQLQDIDELHVVEGAAPSGSGMGGQANGYGGPAAAALGGAHRVGVADTEITPAMSNRFDGDADSDAKYARRQSSVRRMLQRVFPGLLKPQSLPLTTKDLQSPGGTASGAAVEAVRRRIKRRRRAITDPRNLLLIFALLSCLGMMFFVYSRVGGGLP